MVCNTMGVPRASAVLEMRMQHVAACGAESLLQDAAAEPFVGKFDAQSDRDRVLEATDLVALIGEHVQLRAKGREHVGLCPFHDDRTPSLHVVTHKGSGFYKCFACDAAGNALDFMINYHKMDFVEALRALAERAGIQLQNLRGGHEGAGSARTELLHANAVALDFYQRSLADPELGSTARAALDARGISAAMRERFQLGAAPSGWDRLVKAIDRLREHRGRAARAGGAGGETGQATPSLDAFRAAGVVRDGRDGAIDGFRNRLIFPICDELGKPIAFGARQLDPADEPKYLNSPESAVFHKGKGLYGLHLAKKAIIAQRTAIICEGYTDVIACHAAGFENVVATLGTALTREHARVLQRMAERVILLFDGDAAGQRAADRAIEVFFAEPIDVSICTLPDDLDPDEMLRSEGGRGRFQAALDASEDALAHFVRRFRREHDQASGLSGRHQRLQAMLNRLVQLGFEAMPGIRRQLVMSSLVHITGVPQREMEDALKLVRKPAAASAVSAGPAEAPQSGIMGPTLEERGYSNAQARSRREAERSVLALLIAQPELARGNLLLDEGCSLPVPEAITPESFEDPEMRALAEATHPLLESGREFSATELLAEVEAPTLKSLVTELLRVGTARLGDGRHASQRLGEAFADLEKERSRTVGAARTYNQAGQGPDALLAAVQKSRSRGHKPAAFARLVRPTKNQPA